jgi:deoxyxylulose-5-phosphate synthase
MESLFPKRSESEYDTFVGLHFFISAALGMAIASNLQGISIAYCSYGDALLFLRNGF